MLLWVWLVELAHFLLAVRAVDLHPQVGHLVTQRFDPLLEECLILAILLLVSLKSLENISHVEDVALVFLPLLLKVLLLVSDGGVEEEN